MLIRHVRMGAMIWGGLIVLIGLICKCEAVAAVKFQDVSFSRGMISRAESDLRNELTNKYWGCVIADFDRDGKLDMLLPNHGNNPDFYWGTGSGFVYQNPRLMFRDWHGAAAIDVDGDGDLDYFITRGGSSGNSPSVPFVVKIGNAENKRFMDSSVGREYGLGGIEFRGRSTSVLDVDCDGDLDILFVNKRGRSGTEDYIHVLYENMGNGTFVPRTDLGGLENVVAAWFHVVDVNDDGALDIIMMGFSNIQLWMGTCTTKFEKDTLGRIPKASELQDVRAIAEFDYNGDGKLDLYLARGNTRRVRNDKLLENRDGFFFDVSQAASIPMGGQHYHVLTLDANNDGRMDLYLSRVNHFTGPRIPDLMLLNAGGKFVSAGVHGTESTIPNEDGDNANAFDFDGDGRIDIVSGSRNSAWRLYRNKTQFAKRKWLKVVVGRPRARWWDAGLDKPALGAKVRVICFSQGKKLEFVQRVGSQGQSHSQSYLETLHFGVGKCNVIAKVFVEYVGGFTVTRLPPIAVNQSLQVGIYHKCPAYRDGINCEKVIPKCSRNPCPSGTKCETVHVTGNFCNRMSYCGLAKQRLGLSCNPVPCLKLFCPV